jgi:uncharacterized protein (DUF2147 family)
VQRTCLVLAGLCLSAGIACADPTGQWMVEKGYARIRIENCGNSFWGAVAWEQTPGIDNKNPDASKRGRPTLGMPILLDMKPVDPNKWSGKIYNSEDGQTYSSNISLTSPDVLRVQGCVLGILCGGESWTRVIDPLPPGGPVAPGAPGTAPRTNGTAPATQPKPSGSSAMSAQKPGAAPAPPRPFDITTASVEDFCSTVPLNGAAPPPPH